MARPVLMPQVGQDLTEGKIVALNVKLGDKVKKGDIVAEVESEKATFDVEAFETGVVIDLPYKVGDIAIVLKPLMMLGEEGEVVPSAAAPVVSVASAAMAEAGKVSAVQYNAGSAGSSPLARRLANEAGVDLATLRGSGPGGAIVAKDVKSLAAQAATSIIAPGAGLRSLQKGSGDAVVFIHGFGADLSAWRPFILQLGLGNPIYGLDLPAHGASADTSAEHFDGLVAAVQAMVTNAGLRRLHLVGHSVGAAVAARLAGQFDVRSLTLVSPAGLGPQINGDYVNGFLAAKTEAALKAWLEVLVYDPAVLTGALVRATFAGREGSTMVANQKKLAAALFEGNTQLFQIHQALAQVSVPLRVIVGKDDRIIPAGHADMLPAHAAVHRLPQVGHLPQLEAPALTARLVAETVRSAG